jgi:hypothetical protein
MWVLVGGLTAIGLVGMPLPYFGPLLEPMSHGLGGCGGGGGTVLVFLFVLIVAALVVVGIPGVLAGFGLLLYRRGSFAGPLLLFIANLLSLAGFSYVALTVHLLDSGAMPWAVANLVLGAAPAIAAALVVWPMLTGGSVRERVVKVVALCLLAAGPVLLYRGGVVSDFAIVMAAPPQAVASGGGGCGQHAHLAPLLAGFTQQ